MTGIYESLIEAYFEKLEKNEIVPEQVIKKLRTLSDSNELSSTEKIISIIEEYFNDENKDD